MTEEKAEEPKLYIEIMKLKSERASLVEEMDNYFKVYKHRNPCNEWKKHKWCDHYIKARAKKFKNRVDNHMVNTTTVRQKLI